MIQYAVSITNWKGKQETLYIFADNLEHAESIVEVMQGVDQWHVIEPV